jgi:translocation and assembly module TamB
VRPVPEWAKGQAFSMTSPVPVRGRRRWLVIALAFPIFGAGLIAALPWLLSLPVAQRRMVVEANKTLAPSTIAVGAIRLTWFGPTELSNVVLHNAHGAKLIAAPRATFGWNLWQMLVNRPKEGIITIDKGDLDIERFADGTVDLYETLRPVISEHPPVRLIIRVNNGRLRFRDPLFTDPVIADSAQVDLNLGRNSEPIIWDIQLAQKQAKGEPAKLDISGRYSRADVDSSGRHDLALSLKGSEWPWTLANSLIQARGDLTGTLDGQRRAGRVHLLGDATITNLVAIGDILSADTAHLDTLHAQLDVSGGDGSWTMDRLTVTSPLLSVQSQGSIPPTARHGAWVLATVDLAALAKQLPATLHLRDDLRVERGTARLRADILLAADGHTQNWNIAGNISDLAARQGQKLLSLPEPASLTAKLERTDTAMKLAQLDVQSSFLTATGKGDLDSGIVVAATLDLAAFRERFRDWIDLGQFKLAGKGKLDARYQRNGLTYKAGVDASFQDLHLGGLPLVGTLERNQATFSGKLGGEATALGWPVSWRESSLQASSGEVTLQGDARNDVTTGSLAVKGRARAPLGQLGPGQRVEAELIATSRKGAWTTDRLALALVRDSTWGPGIGPDDAIRWEGKGRYDPQLDELVIESLAGQPRRPTEHETWIAGNQKLRATGLASLGAAQVELAANADLASLGPWLARPSASWKGQLDGLMRARRDQDLWNLGIRLTVSDPASTAADGSKMGLDGNLVVGMNGVYAPRSDRLDLSELSVTAPYVQADGSGVVSDLSSHPSVNLNGSLNPDWEALRKLMAEKIEPNARISGRPRPWRLAGTIDGLPAIDRMGTLEGDVGVQIDSLDVFGMRLSAVPIVLRATKGRLTIDPIDAELNSGILHLEPELIYDKAGSTWVYLGQASRLDGAIVNDEVSHRVLSFAAPVLDGATRVEGRVSLVLADAYFPVLAAPGAQVGIDGDVLFDDVRFMPGPLAEQLLSVFQRERRPLAVLRDPINVRIADRKVYQQGLAIPVAKIASIGLDGSVDFEQNLDLVARFSLRPPRSDVPILTPIMENARFDLPIRGTLKNPKIDGEALKAHWKGVGVDLLGNSMEAGVNGLQRLLEGLPVPGLRGLLPPARRMVPAPAPAAPDADGVVVPDVRGEPGAEHEVLKPPNVAGERAVPLTPEERRQIREQRRQNRLQKKADRRLRQNLPPR